MPLHVSSLCAHHQEVKIALHSLWYHHTYRCDDTRGRALQFWPPDDEQMCSKHVEAWNKLIVKQNFYTSSWLITEINFNVCLLLLHFSVQPTTISQYISKLFKSVDNFAKKHYWFSPTTHIARARICVKFSLTNKAYCKIIGIFKTF